METALWTRAGGAIGWRAAQVVVVSALALIRLAVLARLLLPDDFGLFAIAFAATALVMSLTDVGIATALVQRGDPTASEFGVGWTLGVVRGAILALIVAAGAGLLSELFRELRAAPMLRAMAVLPLVQALASIGMVRLTRHLEFRAIAVVQVADAGANTAIAIISAPWAGGWALVAGALGGAATSTVLSYVVAPFPSRPSLDWKALRPLMVFGGALLATAVLSAANDFVLQATVARLQGVAELGVFSVGASVAFVLLRSVYEVLRSVTVPLYARLAQSPVALRRGYRSVNTALLVLIVPTYAVLVAIADGIVAHFLGAPWSRAVSIVQVLGVASVLWCIAEATACLFVGLGRPRLGALLEAVQFATVAVLAPVFTVVAGLTGAALAWLAASLVGLILSRRLLRAVDVRVDGQAILAGAIVGSAVVAASASYAILVTVGGPLGVLGGAFAGIAAALVLIWAFDRRWGLGITDDLRGLFPSRS